MRNRENPAFLLIFAVATLLMALPNEPRAATEEDFHFQAVSLEKFDWALKLAVVEDEREISTGEMRLEPFRVASRGRPPAYRAKKGDILFFMRLRAGDASGKQELETLARFRVTGELSRALFVFMEDPRSAGEIVFKTIDLSNGRVDSLALLILNLSPAEVAVVLPEAAQSEMVPEPSDAQVAGLKSAERLPRGSLLKVRTDDYRSFNTQVEDEYGISLMKTEFFVGFQGSWRPLNRDLIALREDEIRMLIFGPAAVEGSHYLGSAVFQLDRGIPAHY
jgi:hypothetical protein